MKEINLRDYYPFYTHDVIVEVPDEVALLFRESADSHGYGLIKTQAVICMAERFVTALPEVVPPKKKA